MKHNRAVIALFMRDQDPEFAKHSLHMSFHQRSNRAQYARSNVKRPFYIMGKWMIYVEHVLTGRMGSKLPDFTPE